jgi:hypothetical protein
MTKAETVLSPRERVALLKLVSDSKLSVVSACKAKGADRSSFYKWRNRVKCLPEVEWESALADHARGPKKDKPRVLRRRQRLTKRILRVSTAHPSWGCNRVREALCRDGIEVSHQTVQGLLASVRRASRRDRWLALDQSGLKPTSEQRQFLETENPSYRDHAVVATRVGDTLFVDRIDLGSKVPGLVNTVLYVCIDSYSSYALATLGQYSSNSRWSVFSEKQIVPWMRANRPRGVTSTLHARKNIFGAQSPKIKELLREVTVQLVRHTERRGSIERFASALIAEFPLSNYCEQPFEDLAAARTALRSWCDDYNNRPFDGFPNYGATPRAKARIA